MSTLPDQDPHEIPEQYPHDGTPQSPSREDALTHEEVLKVFASNNDRVKQAIFKIVEGMPAERTCGCGSALTGAR